MLINSQYGVFEKIEKYNEPPPVTENSQLLHMFRSYLLSRNNMYEVISSLNKVNLDQVSHVTRCINCSQSYILFSALSRLILAFVHTKLDAGVREKVRLESYAENIVMYVSYEELRRILEEDRFMMSNIFYHLNVFNDDGLMG